MDVDLEESVIVGVHHKDMIIFLIDETCLVLTNAPRLVPVDNNLSNYFLIPYRHHVAIGDSFLDSEYVTRLGTSETLKITL